MLQIKTDILIIGAGASGLMAAYGAAETLAQNGKVGLVTVLEKMPRPARKMMITGKGRCNFTNLKQWNEFSGHIRSKSNFVKPAFYNLTSEKMISFLEEHGLEVVVERGDRAFPTSYHASDVVDTLVRAAKRFGAKIETEVEVTDIIKTNEGYQVNCKKGQIYTCSKLIIATGGLSYPTTGSCGDGYEWAKKMGHSIKPLFPSLTALVPKGYKVEPQTPEKPYFETKGHIDRSTPLSEIGQALQGIQLKNISMSLYVDGNLSQEEFGDIDFTDGGIEGPVGFTLSRNCVKAVLNGSKATLCIDLKPGVEIDDLSERLRSLWKEIQKDPRSKRLSIKEMLRILLGKLMPWDLIPGFNKCNPDILSGKKGNERIDFEKLISALKSWTFPVEGYVGYERCVITAGGVSTEELSAKTEESKLKEGLYFCGEILDMDCDTGGYNLQSAFSTGYLAGQSAAKAIL